MAIYDTAASIINAAAVECGLATATDPFASVAPEMIQLRTLLTTCGRMLVSGVYDWQQLSVDYSFSTGAVPTTGIYPLPADFGYFVDQTGWTPTSGGLGLPLAGPLSPQTWQALVNTNLASSTIYLSFRIAARQIQLLPIPPPANVSVKFTYQSQNWVALAGVFTNTATQASAVTDVVMFDSVMMVMMLAMRYKQAKGLDSTAVAEAFSSLFESFTGTNTPAEVLSLTGTSGFPYINAWTNLPASGFG